MLGIFAISFQFSFSQIPLDTLYISKSTVEDSTVLHARYDYYPNLQAYYDFKEQMFIYVKGGKWITSETIAPNYRGYGLRNNFHVAIDDYSGDEPYILLAKHKLKYPADFSTKRLKPKEVVSLN